MIRRLVRVPSAALVLLALAGAAAAQPAAKPDLANARKVYEAVGCFECHGRVGQGGFAPSLASTQFTWEAFAKQVREPVNTMPAYTGKVLSDKDLADIYAYVKAMPGPKAADALPALLTR